VDCSALILRSRALARRLEGWPRALMSASFMLATNAAWTSRVGCRCRRILAERHA
jgi:hypothetical protein